MFSLCWVEFPFIQQSYQRSFEGDKKTISAGYEDMPVERVDHPTHQEVVLFQGGLHFFGSVFPDLRAALDTGEQEGDHLCDRRMSPIGECVFGPKACWVKRESCPILPDKMEKGLDRIRGTRFCAHGKKADASALPYQRSGITEIQALSGMLRIGHPFLPGRTNLRKSCSKSTGFAFT